MRSPELFNFLTQKQELTSSTDSSQIVGQAAYELSQRYRLEKQTGNATSFLEQVVELMRKAQLPDIFTMPQNTESRRRLPSFVEAVVETAKRLTFLEQLTKDLPSSVIGIICGGSLSYGRFYSVRGQPDPSDIDLFYVVDSSFFMREHAKLAFGPHKGFRDDEVASFMKRIGIFPNLWKNGKADMMSQKFQLQDFIASVKILPSPFFKAEFHIKLQEALEGNEDVVEVVLDYKPEHYPNPTFTQYNFLHQPYVFHISEEPQEDGGVITTIPSIIIRDCAFYPGDHHNHVLPLCEIEFDRNGLISRTLGAFQDILKGRVHQEARRPAFASADILNAHDRRDVFSPQVAQEVRRRFV